MSEKMKKQIKRYLVICLGFLIGSLGFNLFLIPHHLLSGGLSGIAIIIYYMTNWPIGLQLIVYNLPILYLADRVFGRLYAFDTIIGTVLFSVGIDATSFVMQYDLVHDLMLASIFGGVLAGIGFGLIFRCNANSGGLDVVGAVVKKYYSYDMGTVIFVLNVAVVAMSVALFGLELALFTFVSIYVTAEVTNRVAAGFNREKSIVIVSPEADHIAEELMARIVRGVTFIKGEGGFTRENKNIVFIVVSLTQVSKVKAIVDALDPTAFMIVSDTSEVMGRGFTLENKFGRRLPDGTIVPAIFDNDKKS